MLSYINDKLSPHEFDDIVKDDFAALRQMLERRRWMIGQGGSCPFFDPRHSCRGTNKISGGWRPKGRKAEDGPIDAKYPSRNLPQLPIFSGSNGMSAIAARPLYFN